MAERRRRVSFDLDQAVYDRLQALMETTGTKSKAEVVRRALRVYEWLVEQEEHGGRSLEVTGYEEDFGSSSLNLRFALGLERLEEGEE